MASTPREKLLELLFKYAKVPPSEAKVVLDEIDESRIFATEAELVAFPAADGAIAYAEDTGRFWFRVLSGWSGGVSADFSSGDITVTVDPSDPTAADPPAGTVFFNQAAVDAWLEANGTTKFQHVQAFYDALPDLVMHVITINLAAGVHRPLTTSPYGFSFDFGHKFIFGTLDIKGPAASTWPASYGLASLAVTAYQAANRDPYLDFAGTPFAGLDLRGLYAVLSTGQTALIHDHTDSRLFVTSVLSPNPVGGTCKVAQPSAVLRNSLDDVATYKGGTLVLSSGVVVHRSTSGGDTRNQLYCRNVTVDPFGNSSIAIACYGRVRNEYLLLDQETMRGAPFNKTPDGNCYVSTPIGSLDAIVLYLCSIRYKVATSPTVDGVFSSSSLATLVCYGCYFENNEDGIEVTNALRNMIFYGTVFNRISRQAAGGSIYCRSCPYLSFEDMGVSGYVGMGKSLEFRNTPAGVPSVRVGQGSLFRNDGFAAQFVRFVNCAGPLLYLEDGATVNFSAGVYGPIDGGGNSSYGIDFAGGRAAVRLPASAALAPALGAVRMKDGTVFTTLDDVKASSPVVDSLFNSIEKA